MTDCLVMIPAKGTSRGVPAKNLHPLAGRQLVTWTIRQAMVADIGPVIVVTDSPEIAKIADAWGVPVYDEPPEIARDSASMEEVMSWFLAQCTARSGNVPDWLMVLQPTSPLRLAGHIREAWAVCRSGAFESLASVVRSKHCCWEREKEGGKIHPKWPQLTAMRRMLRQDGPSQATENGAIYCVRVGRFVMDETRFCGNVHLYEMPLWTSWEIDGPEELAIVELLMRARMQLGSDGVRT